MTPSAFGPKKIDADQTNGNPEEEAAKDFAAELLVPKDRLESVIASEDTINITSIAGRFGVPETLIRRRMAMLGIPGHGIQDTSRWETVH